jgi:hypothetical protein
VDTLATDVGFVVVVCLGVDDDTSEVGGVAVVVVFFTVFGISHIRASVVLTTFRLGLLGSHNFAFSWVDILVVLGESGPRGVGGADDCCCPYTRILLQIAKSNKPIRTENTAKMELLLFILKYRDTILLFMGTKHKLSIFL